MAKRNQISIKWILLIIVVFGAIVFVASGPSKIMTLLMESNGPSSNDPQNLFNQFLSWMGWKNQNSPSFQGSQNNNSLDQNNPYSRQMRNSSWTNQQNPNSTKTTAASGKNVQNNPGNLSGLNGGNYPGTNAKSGTALNTGIDPNDNSAANTDQGTGDLSQANADQEPGNLSENNPGNNPENNQGNNLINNPGNNPGNTPGPNLGSGPALSSGPTPGNTSGPVTLINLSTINPIPTDAEIAQNTALQNQQRDTIASLMAQREALVARVVQDAQATKYQTVISQNIPAPAPNQDFSDLKAKVKSGELSFH